MKMSIFCKATVVSCTLIPVNLAPKATMMIIVTTISIIIEKAASSNSFTNHDSSRLLFIVKINLDYKDNIY